jgi:hypothetical protein
MVFLFLLLSKISVFIVGIFRFPVRPILEFKAVVVCGTCCIVGNFRQLVSVVAGGNSFRIVQLLLEEQAFDGGHLVLDASLAVFHKKRNCFKF